MRDEHVIERQGKRMVLYGGLLSEAHEQGLVSIETDLVQIPTEANGNVAVVTAKVAMKEGKKFSGIRDASPANVGRMIAPHIIRMAETRAKARALRDAVNAGDLDFEGDEPSEDHGAQPPQRSQARPSPSNPPPADPDVPRVPATRQQVESIKTLAVSRWPGGIEALEVRLGHPVEQCDKVRAKSVLDHLNQAEPVS